MKENNGYCLHQELSVYVKNYINKLKHENKSNNTINSYNNSLNSFLLYIEQDCSNITIETIKPSHIYSFFDYKDENMQKQGEMTIGTKKVIIAHLKAFFSFVEMESDDNLDFTKLFQSFKFKAIKQKPKGLEAHEEQKLLNYIEHEKTNKNDFVTMRNSLILKTMLFSGVRVSEMISIKYADYIDKDELYEISVIGKGNKPRFVYLFKEKIEDELAELNTLSRKSLHVCLTKSGKIIPRQNIDKMIKSYCVGAGIKKIGSHTLRHTFANKFSNNNGNVVHLQDLLGHSSIQTTMIYANPRKEDVRNGFVAATKER